MGAGSPVPREGETQPLGWGLDGGHGHGERRVGLVGKWTGGYGWEWMDMSGYGWVWVGTDGYFGVGMDGYRWLWMGVGGYKWVQMGIGEYGWAWMCTGGYGWIWMCPPSGPGTVSLLPQHCSHTKPLPAPTPQVLAGSKCQPTVVYV